MNIPTAKYKEFSAVGCQMSENGIISNLKPDTQHLSSDYNSGVAYIKNHSLPIVLKADGLAAGKGVVIAETHEEALQAFKEMLQENKFGKAGAKVVIEEFLTGIECSVFVLTDGANYCLLPTAKDYKRIGEGDKGLNTGGMGAISPVPFADDIFMQKVITKIVEPTIKGLQQEKIIYKGFVFIGLIKVSDEPFVIEYNCRMGDPETEVVMPRLASDVVEMFIAMDQGNLSQYEVKVDPRSAATVVLVSGGYPETFEKGKKIDGLDQANDQNTLAFHAGVVEHEGLLLSNGGRVAAITSFGNTIQDAVDNSLIKIKNIRFDKMTYRKDIGYEFVGF
jgi:phosphoribosylamine--glycine ligase